MRKLLKNTHFRFLFILAFFLCPSAASAQQPPSPIVAPMQVICLPDAAVEESLKAVGESVIGLGVSPSNAAVSLWKNQETGSFSIVLTPGSGLSCLLVAGESWESYPDPLLSEGDPS